MSLLLSFAFVVLAVVFAILFAAWLLGVRYIPHTKVGIVEKLWASKGSLSEGRIVAAEGEAGYQTDILRGGVHAFYYPWQYRIHREPLVSIPEGKIGYVYSRDGDPLEPVQTLGRVVSCNNFQDARAFLKAGGQRGRQRAILREGVYAINLALFVVVAEDRVYQGPVPEKNPEIYAGWQAQLRGIRGFLPVVVGTGTAPRGASAAGAHRRLPRRRLVAAARRRHRRRDGARRPAHRVGRGHRARSARGARAEGPRLLPGSGGAAGARRPPGQAAPGPHRRHVLRQPVVCDGRVEAEDGHPDRLRRRRGLLLRQPRRGPDRGPVPLRRAGGARPPRRLAEAAAPGKVPAQPVRAEGRAGAHGELRPALDHRDGRGAPVRQGPEQHRADHGRRLRAAAAALARAAHRLRDGAARRAALRRRQAADQPDARPDHLGLLPRRGADDADARPADAPRGDPEPRHGGTRPAVQGLRHHLRRGADRTPRVAAGRGAQGPGPDPGAVRPAPAAPAGERADRERTRASRRPPPSSAS